MAWHAPARAPLPGVSGAVLRQRHDAIGRLRVRAQALLCARRRQRVAHGRGRPGVTTLAQLGGATVGNSQEIACKRNGKRAPVARARGALGPPDPVSQQPCSRLAAGGGLGAGARRGALTPERRRLPVRAKALQHSGRRAGQLITTRGWVICRRIPRHQTGHRGIHSLS